MTGQIVAPPPPEVEQADTLPVLTLAGDVHPLPPEPKLPSRDELRALAAAARARAGISRTTVVPVPAGVKAGPTDVADILDWLVDPIASIRAELVENSAGGFLVTAADHQRHAEVLRLVEHVGRILDERA